MANIDFNKFEIFIEKCKLLQDFGYTFPTQLTNGEIRYNDIDYDSEGRLYIKIKTYTLFVILSTNEYTHISLGIYYKEEDAIKYKQEFIQNTIYTEEQFDIKEGVKSIYESELDSLIELEENKFIELQQDFNLVFNRFNDSVEGETVEIKVSNPLFDSELGSEDENFEPEFLDVEEFDWILIRYSENETVEVIERDDATIDPPIFYTDNNLIRLILDEQNAIYKVVVHRLLDEENNFDSRIKYLTFTT